MSKIGKLIITLPEGTTVSVEGPALTVKGKGGELTHTLDRRIKASITDNILTFTRTNESKPVRALHGLTRALVANMVTGVTTGYQKTLELVGTGFRARVAGDKLVLALGFSHEVEYVAPAGVKIEVEGTNLIHLKGIDKQAVGQAAAVIRSFKKPEPYKGKGIRYQGEVVRRKAGKAAKSASAA